MQEKLESVFFVKTYGEHFIYQEYFFVITVVAVLTAVGTNMAYKIKFLFGKECTNMYDKKVYSNKECLLSLLTSGGDYIR